MKRCRLLVIITLMALGLGLAAPASAGLITAFTATLSSADPTQLGRLNRDGIPSDWSSAKTYPGEINLATAYHYSVYTIPAAMFDFGIGGYAGYVQVSIDSPYSTTFGSAYLNSYNPTDPGATYLGDPGTSGNFFGVDPLFFSFYLPQGANLVLVFNDTTSSGVGLNLPAGFLVEGFVDTDYTDPGPRGVPDPGSTLLLLGMGLAGLRAWQKRWR